MKIRMISRKNTVSPLAADMWTDWENAPIKDLATNLFMAKHPGAAP